MQFIAILMVGVAIWFGLSNAKRLASPKRYVFAGLCVLPAAFFLIAAWIHFGPWAIASMGAGIASIWVVALIGRRLGVTFD